MRIGLPQKMNTGNENETKLSVDMETFVPRSRGTSFGSLALNPHSK